MINIIKNCSFCLVFLSALGAIKLIRNKNKFALGVLAILAFSAIWRQFSLVDSSRYYSIFTLYCVFISIYALKDCCFQEKKKEFAFFLIVYILIFSQIVKCFHAFRDNYIFDLQESICEIKDNNVGSPLVVLKKERRRIASKIADPERCIIPFSSISKKEIPGKYLEIGAFYDNVFFIVPETYKPPKEDRTELSSANDTIRIKKIENYITNKSHDRIISVYKSFQYLPTPQIESQDFLKEYRLIAFIPEYEAYVYRGRNMIVWLIGAKLDDKTEIVFHLYTNNPENLPQDRVKYGFDNRGFRIGARAGYEKIEDYLVFKRNIPSEFLLSAITVGFIDDQHKILRHIEF